MTVDALVCEVKTEAAGGVTEEEDVGFAGREVGVACVEFPGDTGEGGETGGEVGIATVAVGLVDVMIGVVPVPLEAAFDGVGTTGGDGG